MPLQEFTALLALGFAMSFTPGPNTTLSTALAANGGFKRALPFVCGVPVGWGLLLSVCAFGLGGLILAAPWAVWVVKGVGCAYLLWLAYKLSGATQLTQADETKLRAGFGHAVVLQFVNIKAWMFALAVVAGWLAGREGFAARYTVLLPTMLGFALVSNLSYALVGAGLRGWLAHGRRLLVFNRCMAAVLVLTAFWMLTV
jgi:threonine/homoserine/homoserine lactone efflux protein